MLLSVNPTTLADCTHAPSSRRARDLLLHCTSLQAPATKLSRFGIAFLRIYIVNGSRGEDWSMGTPTFIALLVADIINGVFEVAA